MTKQKRTNSITLIVLHFFLAVGAFGGGTIFLVDPSGELVGMSVTLLEDSIFRSYLVPGLILIFVLGMLPSLTAFGLMKRWERKIAEKLYIYHEKYWSWSFSLYIGFALIIWINVQVLIIKTLAILHFIYIILGLVIQVIRLLPAVQRKYSK